MFSFCGLSYTLQGSDVRLNTCVCVWIHSFAHSVPQRTGCWGMATWVCLACRWGPMPCSPLRASPWAVTRWSTPGSSTCRPGGSLAGSPFHRCVCVCLIGESKRVILNVKGINVCSLRLWLRHGSLGQLSGRTCFLKLASMNHLYNVMRSKRMWC